MFEAVHGLEETVRTLLRDGGGPLGGVTLLLAGFLFGAVHSLLPGHGKTLLATHHAVADAGALHLRSKLVRAGIDGLLVSAMRVASAVLVVVAGRSLIERTMMGEMRTPQLELLGGAVLAAFGAWMIWRALRRAPKPGTHTGGRLPALAIGLVPDPVTAVVMSYAVIIDATALGLIAMLGVALGMATTLTVSASLGLFTRTQLDAHRERWHGWKGRRLDRALRLAGGTLFLAVGAGMVWRAL